MKFDIERYRIDKKDHFRLKDYDPSDKSKVLDSKAEREAYIAKMSPQLDDFQNRFYAEQKSGMLIVLQGMDTSGKDGTIRHVFQAVDPLGVRVEAFKAPNSEELAHDYLWRIHQKVPKRGEIVIFNRSHYEDVLITHVRGWIDDRELERRFRQINDFERMLTENGIIILKFFLHISKDEQKQRLQKRLDNTKKHWKFNPSDLDDRKLWDRFQAQYEKVIRATSSEQAPWYVIPSDSKSSRNVLILNVLLEHMKKINPQFPHVDSSTWPKVIQ